MNTPSAQVDTRRANHRAPSRAPALVRSLTSTGFVDLLTAQAVPLAVGFLVTLVSASLLGPGGRGTLTLLVTGATLFGALAFGSLHVPVVVGLRRGDRGSLRHGLRLVVGSWTAMTAGGLLLLLAGRGEGLSGRLGPTELGWGLVGGGLVLAQLFSARVLQGLGRHGDYRRAVVCQSAVYVLAAGTALVAHRTPLPVYAGWCASVGVGVLVASWLLRRALPPAAPPGATGSTWRAHLRSATANNVGSIGQMVVLRGDVLVVGLLLGAADVGVYGIALSLTELTLVVPEVLALSVFGNRARVGASAWAQQVRRTMRWDLASAVGVAIGVLGVAVLLSRGPLSDYHGLVPLVALVLPGAVLAGYSRIALSALQADDRSRLVWRFGVLSLVLAVGYVPATVVAGTVGTAVMSSTAYAIGAGYLWWAVRGTVRTGAP